MKTSLVRACPMNFKILIDQRAVLARSIKKAGPNKGHALSLTQPTVPILKRLETTQSPPAPEDRDFALRPQQLRGRRLSTQHHVMGVPPAPREVLSKCSRASAQTIGVDGSAPRRITEAFADIVHVFIDARFQGSARVPYVGLVAESTTQSIDHIAETALSLRALQLTPRGSSALTITGIIVTYVGRYKISAEFRCQYSLKMFRQVREPVVTHSKAS